MSLKHMNVCEDTLQYYTNQSVERFMYLDMWKLYQDEMELSDSKNMEYIIHIIQTLIMPSRYKTRQLIEEPNYTTTNFQTMLPS